jgi:multisubunit Na+/H+ antiporter MnhB subunit
MSMQDFLQVHEQGLISVIITVVVILVIAALLPKWVKDTETQKLIKQGRNVLLAVLLVSYAITLLISGNISFNRTTIDRSAGDETQHTLEQSVQNQGEHH